MSPVFNPVIGVVITQDGRSVLIWDQEMRKYNLTRLKGLLPEPMILRLLRFIEPQWQGWKSSSDEEWAKMDHWVGIDNWTVPEA